MLNLPMRWCICAIVLLCVPHKCRAKLPKDTPRQEVNQVIQVLDTLSLRKEFVEVVALCDKTLAKHPHAHEIIEQRAVANMELNRFENALMDFNKALELDQNAGYYSNRGCLFDKKGDKALALKDFQRAVDLDPNDARLWINLADQLRIMGQLPDALKAVEKAVVLSPRRPEALSIRGSVHAQLGNDIAARIDQDRANLMRRMYQNAQDQYRIGDYYRRMLQPGKAIDHYSLSLKLFTGYHVTDHLDLARVLNKLATSYEDSDKFGLAAENYEQALEMLRRLNFDDTSDMAMVYNNYGQLCSTLGRNEEAKQHFDSAVALQRARFGPRSNQHLVALNSVAVSTNDQKQAATLFRDIVEAYESRDDYVDLNGLSFLHNLLQCLPKHSKEATIVAERIAAICNKHPGHPRTVGSLNGLANFYLQNGKSDRAKKLLTDAMNVVTAHPNHQDESIILDSLAQLHVKQGDYETAAEFFFRFGKAARAFIGNALRGLPAQEQLAFLEIDPRAELTEIAGIAFNSAQNQTMYDRTAELVINGKGISRQVLSRRATEIQRIRELGSEKSKEVELLTQQLNEKRAQIANYNGKQLDGESLAELVEKERNINTKLGVLLDLEDAASWISVSDVQQRLPNDAVLIEIARTTVLSASDKQKEAPQQRYAAWLIWPKSRSRPVNFVDLGPADEMSSAIRSAYRLTWNQSVASDRLSPKLLGKLVDEGHIDDAERWIIAPDDELWSVSFEALKWPDGKSEYAVDHAAISYVLTGRDLMPRTRSGRAGPPAVIAPSFSPAGNGESQGGSSVTEQDPTPFIEISRALTGQEPATLFADAEQLPERFLELKNPRLLWLITHGEFADSEGDPRDFPFLIDSWHRENSPNGLRKTNPLQKVKVLMSREEVPSPQHITAYRLAQMDLRQTELVGMAVCDSGTGSVLVASEGVASLRQVFHDAGAHNVIATLNDVPPQQTVSILRRLAERLQAPGPVDIGRVLAEAKRSYLQEMRKQFAATPQHEHLQPWSWASLTLTTVGDLKTEFGPSAEQDQPTAVEREKESPALEALLQTANAKLGAGEFRDAIAIFDEVMVRDKDSILALNGRAEALAQIGELDSAILSLDRLVAVDGDNPKAWQNRAAVCLEAGEYERCIADATRAIDLAPQSAPLYLLRSYAYWLRGDTSRSDSDIQHSLRLKGLNGCDNR